MLDGLFAAVGKVPTSFRYQVQVLGLEEIVARGREKILLLPNHPALIDPILLATYLLKDLHPTFLADSQQIDRPVVKQLAEIYGVRPLPDIKEQGAAARAEVERALDDMASLLASGRNVVIYPSGHIYRTRFEELHGNSAAHTLIQRVPDCRVVLVRTTGLWGSAFSWAEGEAPDVGKALRRGVLGSFASGVLFAPKRQVTIELEEPEDLPRDDRDALNEYLTEWYNDEAPANTYIPYSVWDGPAREVPEPEYESADQDTSHVPAAVRTSVLAMLRDKCGLEDIDDDMRLAQDLGLDSLARTEVIAYIEGELGQAVPPSANLDTVAEVLLAAIGETRSTIMRKVAVPPGKWRAHLGQERLTMPEDIGTLPEAFLRLADQGLNRPLIADQRSGMKTVGDIVTGVFALKDLIGDLPGDLVGIMLPASVGATTVYLATVFAEKTPVMVNWTVGVGAARAALERVGAQKVLTSKVLVEQLKGRGIDLTALDDKLVYLEDVGAKLSTVAKLTAAAKARFGRAELARVKPREVAAVLFTSGSEAAPKAVPLTHRNLVTNLRDLMQVVEIRQDDILLGMLPPFHSFGLTVGVGVAIALGLRVAYHADPTDGDMLARLTEAYGVTALVGTPTFLAGIARAASSRQLASVRLAVTGAEACPERVYDLIASRCPRATVLEGYGITECSPVLALNDEAAPKPMTVGKALPSVEKAIVGVESGDPVARGERGLLLVRGPSIFGGYLEYDGPSPFVEHAGKQWYRTGDLVTEDEDGVMTFRGRLKRFVKIAGEMISLPAIEAALAAVAEVPDASGPSVAVVAREDDERPELVAFTLAELDRQSANDAIREAGLSALHLLREVRRIDEIPVLGTGKTNYRELQALLDEG